MGETRTDNLLTERSFWESYWNGKKGVAHLIPENYLFGEIIRQFVTRRAFRTAIELGGFPGYYAVFLRKFFSLEVTLLDYFIHRPLIDQLQSVNGLGPSEIQVIEADLFRYLPIQKYDLVLSCGLIEHFKNTADIISRHVAFMNGKATLFLALPNFRGVNGWFQKKFDRENYDKHYTDCMDPEYLSGICRAQGLTVETAGYFGGFSVWLEQAGKRPLWLRLFKKAVWLAGKVFSKVFRFESRLLSPYIVVIAHRPQ